MERLTSHAWPGNVRELRNVIERIMILENKECIDLEDLPAAMRSGIARRPGAADPAPVGVGSVTLEEMEKHAIGEALDKSGQNQVQAAKLLGITRDTLRYRMKKFGLLEDAPR
jgi:transcriptional regulator with PAS, ATPase and Fis domain